MEQDPGGLERMGSSSRWRSEPWGLRIDRQEQVLLQVNWEENGKQAERNWAPWSVISQWRIRQGPQMRVKGSVGSYGHCGHSEWRCNLTQNLQRVLKRALGCAHPK